MNKGDLTKAFSATIILTTALLQGCASSGYNRYGEPVGEVAANDASIQDFSHLYTCVAMYSNGAKNVDLTVLDKGSRRPLGESKGLEHSFEDGTHSTKNPAVVDKRVFMDSKFSRDTMTCIFTDAHIGPLQMPAVTAYVDARKQVQRAQRLFDW